MRKEDRDLKDMELFAQKTLWGSGYGLPIDPSCS